MAIVQRTLEELNPFGLAPNISGGFEEDARAVVFSGDCLAGMSAIPDGAIKLIITSPPYKSARATKSPLISMII